MSAENQRDEEIKIYYDDEYLTVTEVISKLTPEEIDRGNHCDQTIIDLISALNAQRQSWEREKALEETKKLYDEAMSICCEHFGFVKFGSVADCLKGLVERDKLRDAAIAQMANCNQHEFQSCLCHKMALEAHEKEGGV